MFGSGNDRKDAFGLTYKDITAAAERLINVRRLTPLLEAPLFNAQMGGRVLVKAECLQITGSFKLRGAYNAIVQIAARGEVDTVVAASSGNHAQGVAYAARACGLVAVVVMPADAPAAKRENTKRYGAYLVLYDRRHDDRIAIAQEIADARKAELVHPFENPDVVAGQGTIGLELATQVDDLGAAVDMVVVPHGGGGLCAGVACAVRHGAPETQIIAVEPQGFDDFARSLAAGERRRNEQLDGSICDALLVDTPGALPFSVNQKHVGTALAVSDEAVLKAMSLLYENFKIVVEPGGAVGIAALLEGMIDLKGRTAVVVVSGGNVGSDIFAKALQYVCK